MEAIPFLLIAVGYIGAFAETERSRAMRDTFLALLGKYQISRKALAYALNLDEGHLSRQLSGRGPGLFAISELPAALRKDLIKVAAERDGLVCLDADDFKDAVLYSVYAEKKRMATATLEERKAGVA